MTFADFLQKWGAAVFVLILVPGVLVAAIYVPRMLVRRWSAAIVAEVAANAARGERLLAGPAKISWGRGYGVAALTNQRYLQCMGGARRDVTFDGVSSFREETTYRTVFLLKTPRGDQQVLAPRAELDQFRAALTQALAERGVGAPRS